MDVSTKTRTYDMLLFLSERGHTVRNRTQITKKTAFISFLISNLNSPQIQIKSATKAAQRLR